MEEIKGTDNLRILMVASEAFPFIKTGGLADAVTSLSRELIRHNYDVRIFLPFYSQINHDTLNIISKFPINVRTAEGIKECQINFAEFENLKFYFLEYNDYYSREGIYGSKFAGDYPDNILRFSFFNQAVFPLCQHLEFSPDIIHCHDWQSGLVPVYHKSQYLHDKLFANTKTLITIHNLAYQGVFSGDLFPLLDLEWSLFNYTEMEFYGQVNFLKSGIVFADALSTVSKQYAKEIQTKEHGCGLEELISRNNSSLHGILNGIDTKVWNPETDEVISEHNYNFDTIKKKLTIKEKFLLDNGMLPNPDKPLIVTIGRLDKQKGYDLIMQAFDTLMKMDVYYIILADEGKKEYIDFFTQKSQEHKNSFLAFFENNEEKAHIIEAAADIFLMPSEYEPCGLNQLISMQYGTIPVANAIGGLLESISDNVNGFKFSPLSSEEMIKKLTQAVDIFSNDKKRWHEIIKNAMTQDLSWTKPALEYIKLYKKILEK